MSEQKFDHVIALIEAAIRHKQAQSWMYEAMALAMQAADRPKEQIERAVMSAVEFVRNTSDLMYLGLYLAELGLDQRALQVFRQVASIEPLRPEPYVVGMKVAQRSHDLEGIQWATVGVLSQGWPAIRTRFGSRPGESPRHAGKAPRGKADQGGEQFEASIQAAFERDSSSTSAGTATPTSTCWSRSRPGRSARFATGGRTPAACSAATSSPRRPAAPRRPQPNLRLPQGLRRNL